MVRGKTSMIAPLLVMLALLAVVGLSPGLVVAQSGGMQDMAQGSMGAAMETGNTAAMDMGADSTWRRWQDRINTISYPITAVMALFAIWLCVRLIKATGLTDKFLPISLGLILFAVPAILGSGYYLTNRQLISMPTLMFVMSGFTSLALMLIAFAFYRWSRMMR